jgi:hypothetical protein
VSVLVALLLSSPSSIELLLVQPSASESSSESSSDEGESCLRRRVGGMEESSELLCDLLRLRLVFPASCCTGEESCWIVLRLSTPSP